MVAHGRHVPEDVAREGVGGGGGGELVKATHGIRDIGTTHVDTVSIAKCISLYIGT